MVTIKNIEEIQENTSCSLALGAFDGLHRGHMAVIEKALLPPFAEHAGVLTFAGSPSGGPAVITAEDKETLLTEQGIERLYSLCFSQVRDIPAEEFFWETLIGRCRAARLCCGEDFRFGKGAAGNVSLLTRLCREAEIELCVLADVLDHGERISSTRIRAAVKAGEIPLANRLLGRPFGFSAEVIHGNHIGTGLGFPTVNQAIPEGFSIPPFGVYASRIQVENTWYTGVTNIGVKPTVGSDRVLSETWIPEFSGDLYGKRLRLALLQFIRPERKFDSLEELKAEIRKNAAQAGEITGAGKK